MLLLTLLLAQAAASPNSLKKEDFGTYFKLANEINFSYATQLRLTLEYQQQQQAIQARLDKARAAYAAWVKEHCDVQTNDTDGNPVCPVLSNPVSKKP